MEKLLSASGYLTLGSGLYNINLNLDYFCIKDRELLLLRNSLSPCPIRETGRKTYDIRYERNYQINK